MPRWRTTIIPALISWPSKILTPSRFDSESRPFLEEPSPFLCAISSRLFFFLVVGPRLRGGLRPAGLRRAAFGFAAAFGFSSAVSAFFAGARRVVFAPIDWISICVSRLRWPLRRR